MSERIIKAIIIGSRPATLLLGVSPVFLGTALGYQGNDRKLNIVTFALALLVVILMQSAANLINDVKDAESGVDNEHRVGPMRVVASGLLSKNAATWAYASMLAAALLIGVGLGSYGGIQLVIIALFSCLFAYLYTGGPFPLSHYALGEFAALLFFGPVAILGSAYLQSRSWQFEDMAISLGPGFLAAAVMAINNLRDRETDRLTKKKTIAVLAPLWLGNQLPWFFILLSLFCILDFAVKSDKLILGTILFVILWLVSFLGLKPLLNWRRQRLNEALKKTSIFVVFYCFLFSSLVLL